tara:strand:+ start:29 stop:658 length:630 start_codon:yes stop_codon:yes gene_type:complete
MSDWMEDLERLGELRDKGFLNDAEFEAKRKEIVEGNKSQKYEKHAERNDPYTPTTKRSEETADHQSNPHFVTKSSKISNAVKLITCGAFLILGSLLPWVDALGGLISVKGTSGDGVVTLALGLVLILIGINLRRGHRIKKSQFWFALLCSIASFAVSINVIANLSGMGGETIGLSIGSGLYICVIASTVAIFVSIFGISQQGKAISKSS